MLLYRLILRLAALALSLRAAVAPWPGAGRLAPPDPPEGTGPLVWLHAASNGELAAARPVLAALRAALPGLRLLITANSITGRDLARGWNLPRTRARLAPHDDTATLARFLDIARPVALVVIENELWPNRLRLSAARGVPVFCLAARLSGRSARRWRWFPALARQVVTAIRWLAPQDEASRARFAALGLPPERLGPAMVLKSAAAPSGTAALPFPRAATLLAASTHEGEEAVVLDAFARARAQRPDLRLILAPRHPRRRDAVEAAIRAAGLAFATRSRGAEPAADIPVYLADTLGEMDRWYAGAGMTFVGGSLVPLGGHTPFEPAAHGSAILTGPHVANAAPAYAALLAEGGALAVTDAESLARAILRLADPAVREAQAEAAARALAPFAADAAIAAFLAALSRETGLPLTGVPDAVHA
ncbi:3-deoxy-D-manno-octulosonic acid transferase [Albidovulum sp.]|jgi:3-deoxy-D-manno-octulosonic-acid transferase|uniref:3-deoxy-D-manno-octulosonic acid transferase n=1 Tax=Albidovulum sp. TaxID=1872424 RepID=UPI00306739C6